MQLVKATIQTQRMRDSLLLLPKTIIYIYAFVCVCVFEQDVFDYSLCLYTVIGV